MAGLGIPWPGLTHILISHFHTDHVGGLAPLLFALKHGLQAERDATLRVLGPQGLLDHLEALARAHGDFVLDPGFPFLVEELKSGVRWEDSDASLFLETYATKHTEESLAYRLETGGRVLGYVGDTGPDRSLGRFMRGCQLLVAECSHDDGASPENHLTPGSLAELAQEASPDLLVTVHTYPPLNYLDVPRLLRGQGYTGRVLAARDGMVVEWKEDSPNSGSWGVDVFTNTG
jgi:ribonuclease BN (tRNA processing enzyme)